MSQNNRYMAVSVTETKADTKKAKSGVQSSYASAVDASVAALNREFGIYKRENEIEMDELRTKIRAAAKSGGGSGEPGKDGVGIESVEQTVTSTESGGENKVEITLTDGQKTEIVIRNGKDGKDGEGGGEGGNVTPESIGALKRGTYERIQGTAEAHKNLNDYTLPGFYNVKTAYVDNCPAGIGVDAVLLVYPWDNNIYNMQEITETAASPMCRRWTRHSNAGTWTAWKAVITEDSKSLISAADVGAFGQLGNYSSLISDLNEFKSIGVIYITSAKANQPTHTSPYATVWNIAGYGSTYMTQHFFDAVSKNMYYRGYVDGVWGAWKQIATTDYAVNKAGDTMTGLLTVPLLRVSNFSQPIEIGKYIDMHNPDSPDDDFSVRLIADGDKLKMQRKGVGALDVFYHTNNKPTAEDVGAIDAFVGTINGTDIKFDTAFAQGEYQVVSNNETSDTPPYALNGGYAYGKLIVTISDGGSYNGQYNWMWQTYYPTSGGAPYIRSKINNGAFSLWQRIATTDYIDEQILKGEW